MEQSADQHREPDWVALWSELATAFWRQVGGGSDEHADRWSERARRFDASVKRRRDEPDPLRRLVLGRLRPEDTFVDVGAGTGSWALPVAHAVAKVTAVEPSGSTMEILRANVANEKLSNVVFVPARWEMVDLEPHDHVLCSHAMYTSPDLIGFVSKMEATARRGVYLVMRVPAPDGILAELNRAIRGHPHDSPNFSVGYNALLSAGFCPNVLIEPRLRHWTNATMEEAVDRARRHLRLPDDRYDGLIRETLSRRLTSTGAGYFWPDGMRSALLWWEPGLAAAP